MATLKILTGQRYLGGAKIDAISVFADLLLTAQKICGFVYYLLDNLVWVANIGVISHEHYNATKWRFWKKVFNLIKNWCQFGRAILLYIINVKQLRQLERDLSKYDDLVCGERNLRATDAMSKFITQHSNVYEQMFVIARNSMRILQLNYKLDIVFWRDIFNPIIINCFGIIQNITALFKIWLKRRYNKLSGRCIQVKDFVNFLPDMAEYSKPQQ